MNSISSYPSKNKDFVTSLNWEAWKKFSIRNSPPSSRKIFRRNPRPTVKNYFLNNIIINGHTARLKNESQALMSRRKSMDFYNSPSHSSSRPKDFSLSGIEQMGLSIKRLVTSEAKRNQSADNSVKKLRNEVWANGMKKILPEKIQSHNKISNARYRKAST